MFPTDVTLPAAGELVTGADTVEGASEGSTGIGDSLAFDYKAERFVLADGTPTPVTGADAVRQWVTLYLLTTPGIYAVYNDAFGVDLRQIVGYRMSVTGYRISEVKRRIAEGIETGCPGVDRVTDFNFSGGTFTLTVKMTDGSEVVINE